MRSIYRAACGANENTTCYDCMELYEWTITNTVSTYDELVIHSAMLFYIDLHYRCYVTH